MRSVRSSMLAALVAALALAACHEAADRPLEPVWGKQPCDHCAMLLDEPRFAAQLATPDGTHLYFDDVGCLAAWLREHPRAGARTWVRRDNGWLDAERARYTSGARTPMGYGFVAAADDAPATVGWSELSRRMTATAEQAHAQ